MSAWRADVGPAACDLERAGADLQKVQDGLRGALDLGHERGEIREAVQGVFSCQASPRASGIAGIFGAIPLAVITVVVSVIVGCANC